MFLTEKSLLQSNHIRESAWREHAPFAFWLMDALRPKRVVELGTHNGFSFLSFCQGAKATALHAKLFAVDTWQGDEHAGFYSNEVFTSLQAEILEHYGDSATMIRSTFAEARPQFADGTIDLLHIDGRHHYEDVLEDFRSWESALSNRSVVLFHDTQVRDRDFGVGKFWAEVASSYPHFEFVHGNGLGVLVTGSQAPETIRQLCELEAEQKSLCRELYARLGANISVTLQLQAESAKSVALDGQVAGLQAETDRVKADAEAANLAHTKDVLALEETIAEYKTSSDDLARDALASDARIATLNTTIQALLSSTSWRVTAPYRWLGQNTQRSRHIGRELTSLAKRQGGLAPFARKAISVVRRDGLMGLVSAWHRVNIAAHLLTDASGAWVGSNDYSAWLENYDNRDEAYCEQLRAELANWSDLPRISIVMPVYNSNIDWLVEAIESVRAQVYPHWELCIADDQSTSETVRPLLDRYAAMDPRIKVIYRAVNGHISETSNSALELATGSWMTLLDQDDLLAVDALFSIACSIRSTPDARLIYSDEDKIENGKRFDPYFKPDWNPDLLRSQNMVCHLAAYKMEQVREIGAFRKGFEGAQDYDLVLRFSENLSPAQIVHIPKVLYHWRSHSGSTAQSGGNKSYAALAGQRALADHLDRTGVTGRVDILPPGTYHVRYSLPADVPLVSIIIPTRNGVDLMRQCVTSILTKTFYSNYEILIVDNNSDDEAALQYFREVQSDKRVRVVRDAAPFNYSAINNRAVHSARGEYVCLLNNDTEVITPDWLNELMGLAIQPGVGAVGARLWYPDNRLQHGGIILGLGGVAGHSHKYLYRGLRGYLGRSELIQTLSAVTAACLVIKKSIYEEVGGLDEENLKVAFNDVDFCLRVREAGYRNVCTPYAELYHHESATRGADEAPEKAQRFHSEVAYMHKRWKDLLMSDPAYSPNLTLDREDFSLAWPPRGEHLRSAVLE